MREQQGLARCQVRRDVFPVSGGLFRVRQGNKNNVGAANGFGRGDHLEPFFPRDPDGFAAFVKADDDPATAVFEVERVGMALGAKAEHGEGFVL